MTVIKCKMCGGDIAVNKDKTFGTCEYCGSTMTLPKVSDEQRAALFNRGNHFRRMGEFDKALAIYENIVRENDADAEAHWCCALCRFGIEYVEDPNTYEYIPTCHRASFDSFLEDVDYLAALENSDGITKRQYQKDAAKIAEVQKGILATSQNEEPFDVFICYKETDDTTKERTKDSIDAQEIYYQLTNEGYRVFFSRITLEDKVGTEYEPYIFAALNSAKVMVVIGSKPEYFNAVWVKNEWSRFLALMRKDRSKLLIPCFKNMDPYDLPEQLSVLQNYDMAKIGFIQDLIRGIGKVINKNESAQQSGQSGSGVDPLVRRAFLLLEEGNWAKADELCEQVLNEEPENAKAYLAKLMAEMRIKEPEWLAQAGTALEMNPNYKNAIRFGDEKLVSSLTAWNEETKKKNRGQIFNGAVQRMNRATTSAEYDAAADLFKTLPNDEKAVEYERICREKAEECRQEEEQRRAEELSAKLLAEEQARKAQEERAKQQAEANASKKHTKKVRKFFTVIAILILAVAAVLYFSHLSDRSSPFSAMQIIAYLMVAVAFTIMILAKSIRTVTGIILIVGTILLFWMITQCVNCVTPWDYFLGN